MLESKVEHLEARVGINSFSDYMLSRTERQGGLRARIRVQNEGLRGGGLAALLFPIVLALFSASQLVVTREAYQRQLFNRSPDVYDERGKGTQRGND